VQARLPIICLSKHPVKDSSIFATGGLDGRVYVWEMVLDDKIKLLKRSVHALTNEDPLLSMKLQEF